MVRVAELIWGDWFLLSPCFVDIQSLLTRLCKVIFFVSVQWFFIAFWKHKKKLPLVVK